MQFRFTCQPGCTNCCRGKGFVYLTEDDLVRAAEFLGMTPAAFEKRYIYRTRNLRRLRTPRDTTCVFLREDGCSIHEAKPTQCRLFPFWPEVIKDRHSWYKAAGNCPGIGKGELVQIETAQEQAREMGEAYPTLYLVRP
ncbi:MAG TPA: YkgJ family cysteine cluster protein [Bryobacteraceae bacterium]|nr:YkgJ family cysteine cluster protein [Bryobacteraceae bacterium]